MTFRKDLLFVVVLTVALFNTNTASVDAQENSLPLSSLYSFKTDPFLLKWTFEIEEKEQVIVSENVVPSKEEKILNRWKEKQEHLWKSLSKEKFIINASAYTAAADECGKSDGITASGLKVEEKRTLACPPSYPFGTKIAIEGVGVLRCEDRGGAIKGNHFDIYMETKGEAFAFGRRNLVAEIVD
ncbi:MAG: 3D domain-containing protein [Candidatus Moranbacteria bacterium]|nr:3D domain-containing protein [Candidatus Moranbacteria bacterium]MDD3964635.1 3D domain-containing protein [Candidatus Moranbacteria bacterium]